MTRLARPGIHVWSRAQVENIDLVRPPQPDPDSILISISTPGRDVLSDDHARRWRRVLHLRFHDAARERDGADASLQFHLFEWEQAVAVLELVAQNLHCEWHVHCDAGMSRSVAIGRFLAEYYQRVLKLHAAATDEFANPHVLRVMRQAAGGGYYR